ncbi:MAG TPA: hypothetical protein VK179_06265 [Bacteroidales bacterium]|nr:hypothetical protein [Bacteroidales bacterium]
MSRKLLYSFFVLFTLFVFISCEKEEGQGGTSSITGKVLVKKYNSNFTTLIEQYYATDEDVFIVYGDDDVYGDKTTTNYNGAYRFDYLREGDYTIYAYSQDSAYYPTQHKIAVMQKVTITGRNKDVRLPDIIILK